MIDTILLALLFISGTILCVQDWNTYSVSVLPLAIFIIVSLLWLLLHQEYDLTLFYILLSVNLLYKILHKSLHLFSLKDIFGTADYLVSIAVATFLCNVNFACLLILLGSIGLIASILRKKLCKDNFTSFQKMVICPI